MLIRLMRRAGAVTGACLMGAALLTTGPARAAVLGDVRNELPSSYTVKVATFGSGSSSCPTWNSGTQRCTHWWLPSGMTDDGIRPGMDTDGFMVERRVLVVLPGGVARYVDPFVYTRIGDPADVRCYLGPGPTCTISS
jgi:hypothetical protein